ncbi:PREDICTED: olfactory receptor 10A7-like [Nanorana parkeri]|uniref:olfactory receptor 10A7-like n=1 Tax=Nanorana parkeri TaxID=125878 RepID=UPI0008546987|nr:PREDICTED: olfactory receptor 10A7-like [Nanorana parkeri]
MCEANNTRVSEVVLHGFQNLNKYNIVFFCVVLLIYIVILVGNLLIITLISVSYHLKHPMYFFLKHLSVVDVLFTSNIVPALLHVILWGLSHLSITACIFQYYVHSFLAFIQSFLLTVMAYDRYVAICDPLHYFALMTTKTCNYLVCFSWIFSYILISCETIFLYQLQYCNSNYIDHFFCDIAPILQIATSDTFIIVWIDFVICCLTIFFPFLFVIGSYTCIFVNILKMSSVIVRKKAFSTCSSHLLIVCLYYGTLIAIYAMPSGDNSHNENKFKSLIYIVLTPFINPIIYSLRNKEIMEGLKKLIGQHVWAKIAFGSFFSFK